MRSSGAVTSSKAQLKIKRCFYTVSSVKGDSNHPAPMMPKRSKSDSPRCSPKLPGKRDDPLFRRPSIMTDTTSMTNAYGESRREREDFDQKSK
ncbi:MAG: hypothetical protein AUG51_26475 [Acidobacteria bacterium 13_1_20CM_3_53_8]|nr:MAG: hypothetical protein AUG51_26475 [Acidobacteria bacterium 13_1_20CM_3_53_8]